MTERIQVILLLCLTSMGLTSVIGMVMLELEGRPILGHLPSIATGCLVALTGLVTIIGQIARQGRMEDKIDNINTSTNGSLASAQQQLTAANATIETLKEQLSKTPH